MITKLYLKNFRGFKEHELPFKKTTVIVGRNNAGKSTIVEALRLISIIANRYRSLGYRKPPNWLEVEGAPYGVSPSLKNMEINFQTLFYSYNNPPATITCTFDNNTSIAIYLAGENEIHAVIRNPSGKVVQSKEQANRFNIPTVNIMPQVAPVQREETILSEEYVLRAMFSTLSSLHFRNQLNLFKELFPKFQEIVAETWPGIQVKELLRRGNLPNKRLYLHVRNESFVAEVSAMGHGLQMWLQTMWFLTLVKDSATIILDEPDVYMHADLQRKLVRLVRQRFPQIIVTTHSVEIMSETEPDEILVVDKQMPSSTFTNSLPAVQRIISGVGSVHNINLARMWHGKRFILVEGKDLKLLKQFQSCLFPSSAESFDSIPSMSIGGWGGWNYAVGSSLLLKNAFGEDIIVYCILDSDFHTASELLARNEQAKAKNVQIHIWTQKEIENFLLHPKVIQRVIQQRLPRHIALPSIDEISQQLQRFALTLEDETFDALAFQILTNNRPLGPPGANQEAREIIRRQKEKECGLLPMVSGKALISMCSQWSQSKFNVSFGATTLAKEMHRDEISEEIVQVVSAIEKCANIS